MTPLIIIGASARAAAVSALRAGYQPWCIDLFADRDLRAIAPVLRCHFDQYPAAIPALLEQAPPGAAVLCTGAMENHLDILETIVQTRPLLGCSTSAMRSVRDPMALATLPAIAGLKSCTHATAPTEPRQQRYLIKPRRGASGAGIRFWSPRQPVDDAHYLQEFITGRSASAIFRTDGPARAALLSVTEQFIGDSACGATGFQYCGGIASLPLSATTTAALGRLGTELTRRHGLNGVFGVDFILDASGDAWPVEVNPRYTAGVELIERTTGAATLLPLPLREGQEKGSSSVTPNVVHAKAVVFAKHDCRVPDLYDLFTPDEVADVPEVGEFTPAGRPICTLFASDPTRDGCVACLRERVERLYTRLAE